MISGARRRRGGMGAAAVTRAVASLGKQDRDDWLGDSGRGRCAAIRGLRRNPTPEDRILSLALPRPTCFPLPLAPASDSAPGDVVNALVVDPVRREGKVTRTSFRQSRLRRYLAARGEDSSLRTNSGRDGKDVTSRSRASQVA
jgi:hypothetical protein